MSTILDALKKSEQERKLGDIPTLSDMPVPEEPRTSSMLWMIGLVAVCLLVVIIVLLLQNQSTGSANSDQENSIVLSNETLASGEAEQPFEVNVVSWSQDPAQRFVIIDGQLARENEFVRPGLKVELIKNSSVILIDRGSRIEISP